jgi:small-conductance mechanosensitive channel
MGDLWLKIKIWTKGIVLGLIVLYVLVFLLKNTGQDAVKLWFWFHTELTISPLLLALSTFLIGIIATILFRTLFNTVQQVKENAPPQPCAEAGARGRRDEGQGGDASDQIFADGIERIAAIVVVNGRIRSDLTLSPFHLASPSRRRITGNSKGVASWMFFARGWR